jgi:hypothetical protein
MGRRAPPRRGRAAAARRPPARSSDRTRRRPSSVRPRQGPSSRDAPGATDAATTRPCREDAAPALPETAGGVNGELTSRLCRAPKCAVPQVRAGAVSWRREVSP